MRASADADPARLSALHTALRHKHIVHFAEHTAQGNALILPEIGDEKALLDLLAEGGWSQGQPQTIAMASDRKQQSAQSFIARNPTLTSALLFDFGGLTWVISGIQRTRHNLSRSITGSDLSEMLAGVTFLAANLLLTAYGRDQKKHPMVAFSDGLSAHLQQQGVQLSAESRS